MIGFSLDLLTVILLVILAFTWGINAGKKIEKEEVMKSVNRAMTNLTTSITKTENTTPIQNSDKKEEFWTLMLDRMKNEKKGDNDQQ